jgi:AcrR family transcriptional regulator
MPPRKRRPSVSRPVIAEEVIDEAARMFVENGYYRTTMQDIADSFGVTHAALYYHFRNKQDILAEINSRALKELLAMATEVSRSEATPGEKLATAFRHHMSVVARNPAFVATFLEHDLEIPASRLATITKMRRTYTDMLRDFYEDAKHEGKVPDVNSWVAVSLLLGACNWIYRWYKPAEGMTPEQLVDEGMRFLGPLVAGVTTDRTSAA